MSDTKVTTLRYPAALHEKLEKVAEIQDTTVTDCIRVSIEEYLNRLSNDDDFQKLLEASLSRTAKLFGRKV